MTEDITQAAYTVWSRLQLYEEPLEALRAVMVEVIARHDEELIDRQSLAEMRELLKNHLPLLDIARARVDSAEAQRLVAMGTEVDWQARAAVRWQVEIDLLCDPAGRYWELCRLARLAMLYEQLWQHRDKAAT